MSDTPYSWGGEHFCGPDVTRLYHAELQRIYDPALGFPVKLDELPDPETFCSICLQWFTHPVNIEGAGPRPSDDETA